MQSVSCAEAQSGLFGPYLSWTDFKVPPDSHRQMAHANFAPMNGVRSFWKVPHTRKRIGHYLECPFAVTILRTRHSRGLSEKLLTGIAIGHLIICPMEARDRFED